MSKLLSLLVAGAGASVVSVGGVYMLKKGGGGEGSGASGTVVKDVKSDPLEHFKTGHGGECAKDTFGHDDINFGTSNEPQGTQIGNDQPADASTYFGSAPTGAGESTKGCLIIDWNKATTTPGNKWTGAFTWTWSFKNGDKGFIVFGFAKTKDNNKLDATGGFYLLEKKTPGETNKYEVKYYKEVTSSAKEISDLDNQFPKANTSESEFNSVGDYWGFADSTKKLDGACGADGCATGEPIINNQKWSWSWTASTDNGKGISSWCNNLGWFTHIFDVSNFQLQSKLSTFKGVWTDTNS